MNGKQAYTFDGLILYRDAVEKGDGQKERKAWNVNLPLATIIPLIKGLHLIAGEEMLKHHFVDGVVGTFL